MNPDIFQLFACNIPVKGAKRSIICDVQRGKYHPISNELFEILKMHKDKMVSEIKALYPAERTQAIDQYFSFLMEQELGFWLSEDGANFLPIDLTYERPERINNAVVDVTPSSRHDYESIFTQLDGLGCKHLELRFYDALSVSDLDAVLKPTLQGRLRSIQVIVKYNPLWTDADYTLLCSAHQRISQITLHSAPEDKAIRTGHWNIIFFKQRITSAEHCGQVHPGYFATNIDLFSEARQFNTCLNKKVGIDVDGNIKNCPSCQKCYGKVAAGAIESAVKQPEFQQVWAVNKDQVDVCKDCEFRYICTDCRVYLSDPNNPLSKPAKCSYNPYTGEWEDK
jgi:SPASM domain peptide maturase of grasp-with-spasm system